MNTNTINYWFTVEKVNGAFVAVRSDDNATAVGKTELDAYMKLRRLPVTEPNAPGSWTVIDKVNDYFVATRSVDSASATGKTAIEAYRKLGRVQVSKPSLVSKITNWVKSNFTSDPRW